MTGTELVGIVNITADSFSDGGKFLSTEAAIAQGEKLLSEGADWLDLGAESSNPDGQRVDSATEIARLAPVVQHFKKLGAQVAVDTHKAAVMRAVLDLGADLINDITALVDPQAARVLVDYPTVPVVLMFARNRAPRAEKQVQPYHDLIPEIQTFFTQRLAALTAQGLARERFILDPGMGFFLGSNPEPSLWVLKHLGALHHLGQPLYVSTSRKSFIGTILGKPPGERAIGTLVSEIWALNQGVAYIRTHEISALAQARQLWMAIEQVR
ncbi:dihydropteroate synthase [Anthocerotibacter panamensis]|uniref:dihydropteroate synthase n=1 Tax=Anthocerotibacter panamensis TaxID=2857077 RepID=UPI001C4089DC|nr:dihydropteroate synthase [Anthocerotibacter panamensis]